MTLLIQLAIDIATGIVNKTISLQIERLQQAFK